MSKQKKPRPTHKRGNRPNVEAKAYDRCVNKILWRARQEQCPDEYIERIDLLTLSAVEAITHGHGTKAEWDSVALTLNQAWILAKQGIGPEAIPVLEEAQDAMRRAIPRFHQSGKIALDGDGIKAVRDAINLWREQIKLSTFGQVEESARVVAKFYKYKPENQA